MTINYTDFEKVDIRSGTIVKAETFERARNPSYKVWVDFGEGLGVKQTSAQITENYTLDELVGRQVMGCINLAPKNIAGFMSEFLLVGFPDSKGKVSLAGIDPQVPNGGKLF